MEEQRNSDVVVIVGGVDPEICGAIATKIRGMLYGECVKTVPMVGFTGNPAYVDHDRINDTWCHQGSDYVGDRIIEESDDMFDTMMKRFPHLYDHLTVAIEVVPASVNIESYRTERVLVELGGVGGQRLESVNND